MQLQKRLAVKPRLLFFVYHPNQPCAPRCADGSLHDRLQHMSTVLFLQNLLVYRSKREKGGSNRQAQRNKAAKGRMKVGLERITRHFGHHEVWPPNPKMTAFCRRDYSLIHNTKHHGMTWGQCACMQCACNYLHNCLRCQL